MKTVAASSLTREMEQMHALLQGGPGAQAMEDCGQALSVQLAHQFDVGETPQGEPWPQWRFRKPESSDSHKTLWDSGRLRDSLVSQTGDSIRRHSSRDLHYGTSVEYASTHDEGAEVVTDTWLVARGGAFWIPPGTTLHIPQRRFSGWAGGTLEDCGEAIAVGALSRVFGG